MHEKPYHMNKMRGAKMEEARERDEHRSKRGSLRSIRIEVMGNGFTVECNYQPKKGSKGDTWSPELEDKHVFTSADDVTKFVKSELS